MVEALTNTLPTFNLLVELLAEHVPIVVTPDCSWWEWIDIGDNSGLCDNDML